VDSITPPFTVRPENFLAIRAEIFSLLLYVSSVMVVGVPFTVTVDVLELNFPRGSSTTPIV
jgi:hypothetical protein